MKRLATIAALAGTLMVGASAQPVPKPVDPAAEEASIHAYGDRDKTCQEWADGCRTCTRANNGDPVCSNIGLACQPVAITCARRTEAPK